VAHNSYSLEDLNDDLERYSTDFPDYPADEILVVVEVDGKRLPIATIETENDRGYNMMILHIGEELHTDGS